MRSGYLNLLYNDLRQYLTDANEYDETENIRMNERKNGQSEIAVHGAININIMWNKCAKLSNI